MSDFFASSARVTNEVTSKVTNSDFALKVLSLMYAKITNENQITIPKIP
jgi:hypothetical protein